MTELLDVAMTERALGALLLGGSLGLILWISAWLRAGAAAITALASGAAFLGGGWAPGALVALAAALPGLGRRLVSQPASRPARPGVAWAVAGLWLPAGLLLARPALSQDAWVLAAAIGGLAGFTADSVAAAGRGAPGRRYRLHALRPAPDGEGIPSLAGIAGIAAAIIVAVAGWSWSLLGPGDPALVAMGGTGAMLIAAAVRARGEKPEPSAPLPPTVAATSGAGLALTLVAFLP